MLQSYNIYIYNENFLYTFLHYFLSFFLLFQAFKIHSLDALKKQWNVKKVIFSRKNLHIFRFRKYEIAYFEKRLTASCSQPPFLLCLSPLPLAWVSDHLHIKVLRQLKPLSLSCNSSLSSPATRIVLLRGFVFRKA